ncbi:unnamed protein product, partial [Polarella glacialis]
MLTSSCTLTVKKDLAVYCGTHPQDLFSKLDLDGNGQLSRPELLSIILRLEPGLSPAEQEAIWDRFDVDRDGLVSIAEFCRTLQGVGPSPPAVTAQDPYRESLGRRLADDVIQRITTSLTRSGTHPQDLFSKLDLDGNGNLSRP